MKSIKFFAVTSAVALLSTTGFTSCNQKNGPDIDPGTGNYDGSTVKTEFVIHIAENVAGADNGTRYMPAATVQQAQSRASFRGMDKIVLIPFDKDFNTRLGKNIPLTAIPSATNTGSGNLNSNQNIYYDNVAIPLGTKRLLFYGKAIDDANNVDVNTDNTVKINTRALKHKYGIVTANSLYGANTNPSGISFDLVPILSDAGNYDSNSDNIPDDAQELADYLTTIATCDNGAVAPETLLAWSGYTTAAGGVDGIKDLYTTFTGLKAGSSASVLAAVEDLYNTLEYYQDLRGAGNEDPLVTNLMNAILVKTDVVSGSTVGGRTLGWDDAAITATDYPNSIGLPDGAAYISWDPDDSEFKPKSGDDVTIGTGTNLNPAFQFGSLSKFVYPPSLQYFAESTIETATTSKADLYNEGHDWSTILAAYEDNGVVKSNTKSVAIKDEINYGVGRLDVIVKRGGDGGNVSWTDNGGDESVSFGSTGANLKWKGLLISGQRQVKYDFTQNTEADEFIIYDDSLTGHSQTDKMVEIPNDGSTVTNHTLVFSTKDNISGENMSDDVVYIVLELKNTLGDFIGIDGKLIPEGCTFYLVGQLTAGNKSSTQTTHPENYNIFYKDYITTANITLGADCLKKAYYTIPDMRSSNLELGFSVNLAWQAGLVFDITF